MRISKTERVQAGRTAQRAVLTALAIAAGLAGFQGHAGAVTIQNGSFTTSQPGRPPGTYLLTPGDISTVPGWTYGSTMGTAYGCMIEANSFSGCVAGVTSPGVSPDGGNYLAIDVDSANNGFISQVLSGLKAGGHYTLSFYQASINGDTVPDQVEWLVSLAGTLLNPIPTVMSPAAGDSTPWTLETISFTVTADELAGGDPTLRFLANGLQGGPPIALLDGVNLEVPEPASLSLMGLGIVGLVGLRRRRARRAG